jgi:hypothetical protein
MIHPSPPSGRHLAGWASCQSLVAPLTVVGSDKIGWSSLPNRIVQFLQFRTRAFSSYLFRVATHFCDSTGESTTSSTSSMKGENSSNNRSNLDMGNIFKPTFDTLTEEGRKPFEALPRQSWRALPLTLWSDAAGDYSLRYYIDRLQHA